MSMTKAGISEDNGGVVDEKREKKRKPGIVYLSSIPPNMNVAKIREYFGKFGELGNVFLQNTEKDGTKTQKRKKSLHYSEGWIEFKSKRKAKQMHLFMNNQPVGGKKKNHYYDILWNIKYLPRFKWAFLKQRLEYEREVHRQRMGAEISQVRRETDHFIKVSEVTEKKQKQKNRAMKEGGEGKQEKNREGSAVKKRKKEDENTGEGKKHKVEKKERAFIFKQKETEDEKLSKSEQRKRKNKLFKNKIAQKKKKKKAANILHNNNKKPSDFLDSVFVGTAE